MNPANQQYLTGGPNQRLAVQSRADVMARVTRTQGALANLTTNLDTLRNGSTYKDIDDGYSVEAARLVQRLEDSFKDKEAKFQALNNAYKDGELVLRRIQEVGRLVALRGESKPLENCCSEAALATFEFLLQEMPQFYAFLRAAKIETPSVLQEAMERAATAARNAPDSQLLGSAPQPTQVSLKKSIDILQAKLSMEQGRAQALSNQVHGLQTDLAEARAEADMAMADKALADDQLKQLRQVIDAQREELTQLRPLQKDTAVVPELLEEISGLNRTVEDLQTAAEAQSRALSERDERVKSHGETIQDQNRTIQTQTQKIQSQGHRIQTQGQSIQAKARDLDSAVTLVSLISVGADSDISRLIMDRVLRNPVMAPGDEWNKRAWRITSWTSTANLMIRPDDHGIHGIALDILAILRAAPRVDLLLTRLHGLLAALAEGTPLLMCIIKLLMESFTQAMSRPDLHMMHRLFMCQIACAYERWDGDGAQRVGDAIRASDPQLAGLLDALQNWKGDGDFPYPNSLTIPDQGLTLVGFGWEASGMLMLRHIERQFVWVGTDNITNAMSTLTLTSLTQEVIVIEIKTTGDIIWGINNI